MARDYQDNPVKVRLVIEFDVYEEIPDLAQKIQDFNYSTDVQEQICDMISDHIADDFGLSECEMDCGEL